MKCVVCFLLLVSALILGAVPIESSGASLVSGPIIPQASVPTQARPVGPSGREHFPGEPPDVQAVPRKKPMDLVTVRKEARELADMAGKIPGQVDLLSKNTLPKDLVQQLKQIEKLAKNLRKQIEP